MGVVERELSGAATSCDSESNEDDCCSTGMPSDDEQSYLGELELIQENVRLLRWQCPICCKSSQEFPGQSLFHLTRCGHEACSECVTRSIQLLGCKCPHCSEAMDPLDVAAHASDKQWVEAEQDEAWRAGGFEGIRCTQSLCHGVIPRPDNADAAAQHVGCQLCGTGHCTRCCEQWSEGHLCADIREAQRAAQEAERAATEEELLRARIRELRQLEQRQLEQRSGCCALQRCLWAIGLARATQARRGSATASLAEQRFALVRAATDRQVTSGDKYKPCPRCKVMTLHDGGCNMMRCMCGAEWCFACGSNGSGGCSHFQCATIAEDTRPAPVLNTPSDERAMMRPLIAPLALRN